ncbi:MAG: helix-turn-helix domain-containing protein [Nitrososphaerales archaeon]
MIQLQFTVAPEAWISDLCKKDSATVRILSMKADGAGSSNITHFVEITSDKTSAEDLTEQLHNLVDVTDSDVATVGENRIVGAVTSNDCKVCSIIMESRNGYFVGPATTETDCQLNYKLFLNGDGIPGFLQSLHDKGILYKISEIAKMTPERALTSKQERVLKSALELGYYDFPKRISTEDLSRTLHLAPSTISEILRRAERRIISGYFKSA